MLQIFCSVIQLLHLRSGLAWKHHIDIGAGVVDEDYRGNLGDFCLLISQDIGNGSL